MKISKTSFFFILVLGYNFNFSVKKKNKIIIKKIHKKKHNQPTQKNDQILKPQSSEPIIETKKLSFKEKFINFFKNLWNLIKNFFQKIKELLGFVKPKENEKTNKERLLVKIVTTAHVKGNLINQTFDINGVLMAKKKEAISIPTKLENFQITYILPEYVSWVKKDTKLVEFDVKQLEIQYEKNKEQIGSLQEVYDKEQELLNKGGLSKKEVLDVESRLNKLLIEQEMIEDQISHKIIKAPFDGIISRPEKNETGQNARTKRGDLFIIHDSKNLLLEGYINGTIFDEILIGDEAVVTIFHNQNQVLKGKVISKELFSEQNTGLYKILINVQVESNNNLIGQPAQSIIKSKKTTFLTKIPEKSIFFDNGQMAVFIIIKNQAVKRNIVVQKADGKFVYVTGLPEECTIVTDEANVLNNGDFVKANKIINIEKDIEDEDKKDEISSEKKEG